MTAAPPWSSRPWYSVYLKASVFHTFFLSSAEDKMENPCPQKCQVESQRHFQRGLDFKVLISNGSFFEIIGFRIPKKH